MTDRTTPEDDLRRDQTDAPIIEKGDIVIACVLVVAFAAAFVTAWQWEAIASYFPLMATGLGIVLCSIFLARCVVVLRKHGASVPPNPAPDVTQDSRDPDDASFDQADSDRAFFASVGVTDWAISLAYFVAFFVSLYVLGLYPTSIIFTVVYLRFQARTSWTLSVIYTAVLTAALYALFEIALKLPVPSGLIGLSS